MVTNNRINNNNNNINHNEDDNGSTCNDNFWGRGQEPHCFSVGLSLGSNND